MIQQCVRVGYCHRNVTYDIMVCALCGTTELKCVKEAVLREGRRGEAVSYIYLSCLHPAAIGVCETRKTEDLTNTHSPRKCWPSAVAATTSKT